MQHLILTNAKTKTAFHYYGQPTLLQHVLDCLERHPNLGSHCFSTPYDAITDIEPKFNLIHFERNLL